MSTFSLNKMPAMTLEQRRSQFAWDSVQGCNKDYVKLAKSAPALIMNNGLMQTLSYLQDKKHSELLKHLREWLATRYPEHFGQAKDFQSLIGKLLKVDSSQYRQATEESLLLLRWIRQFAAALGA
ncbi:MAG: type III-B CRISPR module-associated protein Cmr5 [Candidatus Dechloromonas phosphoritropha]|nr:type III-B CRISPR module-associated protein Cmr5 [Candidatus Dechloromonas phosphoritropha]MBP8787676.1 type III-B CRISPR module-associated protein Cmr5 [Azonexus sp.]MBP9228232.1 type III-B CRISPR module-associated protein Cmr5 [Azonexus sp.]